MLKMADKPFQVPAEGVVDYQHFTVDPGFTEDKWMIACEARPGNRSVVHHILVFLQSPGGEIELLRGSLLAAYAPGSPSASHRSGHGQTRFRPVRSSSSKCTTRPTASRRRTRARWGCRSATRAKSNKWWKRLGDQRRVRDSARQPPTTKSWPSTPSRTIACCWA